MTTNGKIIKVSTKIAFLDEQDNKFFGEGPCQILRTVEETGSLHAAAQSMGISYTKAFKLIKNAEKFLGFSLTHRVIGGKNGGGSTLTKEGREWIEKYESYRNACLVENERLYAQYF